MRRSGKDVDHGDGDLALQLCATDVGCDGGNGKKAGPRGRQLPHEAAEIGCQSFDAVRLDMRQRRRRMRMGHGQTRHDLPFGTGRRDCLVVKHGRTDTETADKSEVSAFLHGGPLTNPVSVSSDVIGRPRALRQMR